MSPSTIAPPDRTTDQRIEALNLANDIRSKRAELKVRLRTGKTSVVSVISSPPPYALTMTVFDLLKATPKIGKVKATRILADCRISPSKTLGGQTARQRTELILNILSLIHI